VLQVIASTCSSVSECNWSTSLNLNNVTDRKYLLSLYSSDGPGAQLTRAPTFICGRVGKR